MECMDIKILFGRNVRKSRELKGWSQEKLAERSGLHRTYISGIERGVRNPTIEIVREIALALDEHPSSLLEFEEQ
ncbi:helix-turn-helix domain-containing protein [cf. Phormidesmis sp. LEGE 11477]|uniref:helix-turn-helix domain-containing protein n=1 Tax=cf. Phormidesmis sp. LEGE 11477 TaxID=1828680 RepID=UPI00351D03DF